jgi:hypothetical protein
LFNLFNKHSEIGIIILTLQVRKSGFQEVRYFALLVNVEPFFFFFVVVLVLVVLGFVFRALHLLGKHSTT